MTLEFKDGSTLESLSYTEVHQRVMGEDRNTLVITFDSSATSADDVLRLMDSPENTELITITNEEQKRIYKDFSILHKIIIDKEEIAGDEGTVKAVFTIKATLLEKTYAEKQLDIISKQMSDLSSGMDTLNEVTADIIGGVY